MLQKADLEENGSLTSVVLTLKPEYGLKRTEKFEYKNPETGRAESRTRTTEKIHAG